MKKEFKVNFDVCTYCNHKCTFCSNEDVRTIKHSVDYDSFIKTMNNVTQYVKIKKLSLSAKGEVLLNKDFLKIVEASKRVYKIPYVYFSTNGSLLNKKFAQEILEAGIDSIKFSINATTKEDYSKIHLKDDFEQVIKNLKDVLELKQKSFSTCKIFISIVSDRDKEDICQEFHILLGKYYLDIEDIFVYALQYTPKIDVYENFKVDASDCLISVFNEIYINSDCSLGFCCKDYFDEINFGSLLEYDFLELYDGDRYTSMRQRFIDNSFDKDSLCYKCLLFEGLNK